MATESFEAAAAPQDDNPLINPPALPHDAPPLDQVSIEHFEPAFTWALEKAEQEIAAIKSNPEAPDFENTIEALTFAGEDLDRIIHVLSLFSSGQTSDRLDAVEEKLNPLLSAFGNSINLDETLFDRVKAVYDRRESLALTPEQDTLLKETYKGFERSGALLSDADKARLREVSTKLSTLGTKFSTNLLKATMAYSKVIEDEADLAGLPARTKKMMKQLAQEAGHPDKWLVKLAPSSLYIDIMQYAENRALRKEVAAARRHLAYEDAYDNRETILNIVKLRHEKAQLLGHKNYAAYVLSDRMAGSQATVEAFLDDAVKTYKGPAEDHLTDVRDFARAVDGIADFAAHDSAYYSRRLKEARFSVDLESVRPYFELDNVLDGMFDHAARLFNIRFEKTAGKYPVYNEDMTVYEVFDRGRDELIGVFYTDFYARPESKKGGAWMNVIRSAGEHGGTSQIPLIINCTNFAKPQDGEPTPLSLDEVTTLFHEFGHGLHGLLAEARYPELAGPHVKWDFVELPSQVMENWATEKEVLQRFARHHETNEPMPDDLIDKIKAMEQYGAAHFELRQTELARIDMAFYTTDPADIEAKGIKAFEDEATHPTALFNDRSGAMATQFAHIFAGGYAAGYYSYAWARVLDADVFERFRENGLYDPETAQALRTLIARGGTENPARLFRDMMGRDPDPAALYRREGIDQTAPDPHRDEPPEGPSPEGPSPKGPW